MCTNPETLPGLRSKAPWSTDYVARSVLREAPNTDSTSMVSLCSTDEMSLWAYTQLFRDGRIEGVMSDVLLIRFHKGQKCSVHFLCEHSIIEFVPSYLKFCALIGLEAPVWPSAALTGCQGVRIKINRWPDFGSHTIDRDVVHLPEMEIPSLDIEPANFLRPMFDALWNAAGFEKILQLRRGWE